MTCKINTLCVQNRLFRKTVWVRPALLPPPHAHSVWAKLLFELTFAVNNLETLPLKAAIYSCFYNVHLKLWVKKSGSTIFNIR